MRVLTVLESASRVDGGIFEAELALQRELVRLPGVGIEVVALRDDSSESDAARWLPLVPRLAEVQGPRGFGFSRELGALLETGADIGYCAALWKYPAWAFLNWQKKTGRPSVVAPHGSLDAWALGNSRWKKRAAAWLFKNEQLRRATCFRALCAAEADAIRAYGLHQRIEVVPNGVVLPADMRTATGDMQTLAARKRLLFLGRIHPKKGLAGALRAWARLKGEPGTAEWGEWEFVIAGWDQGGHEDELKTLCAGLGLRTVGPREPREAGNGTGAASAAGDVVFYGPAFGREKEALLRSAEAFVLPSFSEGLPMSVLEAWAYELPVVMTAACHLPEGFASQAALELRTETGGKVHGEGLRTLLKMTHAERREMGRRGRRLVEERFTWPTVAAQMREIYESLT